MESPAKILLIRFSSIGDIILTSPLVRILRRTFPLAQIDFVTKRESADLVRHNPNLSSVIEFEEGQLQALRTRIRKERYDAILDLHGSLRSRMLRRGAGVKTIGVIDKRIIKRFLLVQFKWNLYGAIVPVAERYIETATSLGVHDDGGGCEVYVPSDVSSRVSTMLDTLGPDTARRFIGIVPMAKHKTKMWPEERFVEFGKRISGDNVAILIFGSASEIAPCDHIAGAINAGSNTPRAYNLAGKLNLLETAAAFDRCDRIVTNDTGLMHLAAARGRKITAIFGPTVKEFGFFPYRAESVVVEHNDLSCKPCSHIGLAECPMGHFRCMNDIAVDEVAKSME
ncbi:MAG TPA: glycosyltransferase family 9 protein [Bacteroidota bacterium]|nr:glycosyltransferase family 9 protein [Bacteroidota bacterium]